MCFLWFKTKTDSHWQFIQTFGWNLVEIHPSHLNITKASITVAKVNSVMTYIDSEKSFPLSFWSFFPFCHTVQIKPVFYWLTLYDLMPPACRSPWVLNPLSLTDFLGGLFFRLSLPPFSCLCMTPALPIKTRFIDLYPELCLIPALESALGSSTL